MTKNEFYCDCSIIHDDVVNFTKSKMLNNDEFKKVSEFLKTLGDFTRVKICWALLNHEMCVCDIANLLSMTKSAISHQLRELRLQNLVKCRKESKTVYYSLADEHVSSTIKNVLEHVREK